MNNKLLSFREKGNLTQKEVAKNIGITTSAYGMIELGSRKPSLNTAYKIAKFFKTSIEEIFFT